MQSPHSLGKPVHVSRRAFLAVAGSIAAAGLQPCDFLLGEEKSPTMGFGFSLYGMKAIPIERAIALCAEIGYDCVEIPVQAGWPADSLALPAARREEIRLALSGAQVRLTSLMENLHAVVEDARHKENLRRIAAAGELGHELSPDRPPLVETILGGRPEQWDDVKEEMAKRLADWAAAAEKAKTVIAVKAHVGGAMHLPEHPVWLAERVGSPWIRCAYDYSHFQLRGVDLAKSIETLIPASAFVHIKDGRGDAGSVQFLFPGEGTIDYPRLLGLAAEAGYRGDVVVEVSGQIHGRDGYDAEDAARRCYKAVAPAFETAGIRRA